MPSVEPKSSAEPILARSVTVVARRGSYDAFLATPNVSPWRSAAVVIADTPSVEAPTLEVIRKLAQAGHGALALGLQSVDSDATALEHVKDVVDSGMARLRAEAPAPPPRFGVVGFGRGGLSALVAGYRCQLGAAITFDGEGPRQLRAELPRLIPEARRHAAHILCLVGVADAALRAEDLAAIHDRLETFGMKHTFIVYPRTQEGFHDPSAATYRPTEAQDAWQRLLTALDSAPRLRNRSPPSNLRKSLNAASRLEDTPPPATFDTWTSSALSGSTSRLRRSTS